jgi:hypothetical protein
MKKQERDSEKSAADQRGSFKVPPDLKREIKIAAVMEGMSEHVFLREVWEFWKKSRNLGAGSGHLRGALTIEETETCDAVVDFLRDKTAKEGDLGGVGVAALNAIIKRYRSKGS